MIKGEKAVAYNKRNIALFSHLQVTKTIHHNYGYDYDERKTFNELRYKPEPEPKTVYFADGSGYIDFGGPCGPLYFDRNGDS